MTDEQKAAYVIGDAAVLVAELMGMMTANMQRQHRGEAMAYDEQAFQEAVARHSCHHNATLMLFHG